MGDKEELQKALAELERLKEERRLADEKWRAGVDAANAHQSQMLGRIEASVGETRTDIKGIHQRLKNGDERMQRQDEWHAEHDQKDAAEFGKLDHRLGKIESHVSSQRKVGRWLLGIVTTLGLGWLAAKFGWK